MVGDVQPRSLVVQEKLVEYVVWLTQDQNKGGHPGATHSAPALTDDC